MSIQQAVIPPSITHKELIAFYQAYEKAKNGPCAERTKCRTKLANMFMSAIAETHQIRSFTLEMLLALDELTDPISGRRICPKEIQEHLAEKIETARAEEDVANQICQQPFCTA